MKSYRGEYIGTEAGRGINLPVGDIGFNSTQHVNGSRVRLHEHSIKDLLKS